MRGHCARFADDDVAVQCQDVDRVDDFRGEGFNVGVMRSARILPVCEETAVKLDALAIAREVV